MPSGFASATETQLFQPWSYPSQVGPHPVSDGGRDRKAWSMKSNSPGPFSSRAPCGTRWGVDGPASQLDSAFTQSYLLPFSSAGLGHKGTSWQTSCTFTSAVACQSLKKMRGVCRHAPMYTALGSLYLSGSPLSSFCSANVPLLLISCSQLYSCGPQRVSVFFQWMRQMCKFNFQGVT